MIAVGLTALFVMRAPEQVRVDQQRRAQLSELRIDDRSPEAVAESFYDAWRRRAWAEAERIATGEARARVQAKRAAEDDVHPEDREMARQVWRTLAAAPLRVYFQQADLLDGGIALRGIAAYDFVGRPYRREVEFLVVQEGSAWRVERMVPGRVITPLSDIVELDE
jgi:hypothetical protein